MNDFDENDIAITLENSDINIDCISLIISTRQ